MLHRKTALLKAHPRQDWGGTYADSGTWASWFKSYKPHDFGMMEAQTFASSLASYVVNKPLLWMTQGQGNTYELPGGHREYQWQLATDTHTRATIVRVDPNLGTQPGKAGQKFFIYVDRGWYMEPVLLKTEGSDAPLLRIHGQAYLVAPGVYRYTVSLQDGNPAAYINPTYLLEGKTISDAGTMVSDELNMKYGGIEFGSQYNLQSHIGYVAREIVVTDKFIRLEKSARERGNSPSRGFQYDGKEYDGAIGTGYIVARRDKNGKVDKEKIKQGAFLTTAEALLGERIAMDKNMIMTFGRTQVSKDEDSQRTMTMGAGWLQLAKEGNYREHNGNITLGDFTEQLDTLAFNTLDFGNRVFEIHTGSEGIKLASALIAAEAGISPFVFDSNFFIDKVSSEVTDKALRWGAQFTEFRAHNGIILRFVFDPTKDNTYFYPELDPETGKPLESSSYDIFDLGQTDAAPRNAKTRANVAYVYEPEAEEYYMTSNVYDLMTGAYNDGTKVASKDKEAGIHRASSCKFEVWDISRTMRIKRV